MEVLAEVEAVAMESLVEAEVVETEALVGTEEAFAATEEEGEETGAAVWAHVEASEASLATTNTLLGDWLRGKVSCLLSYAITDKFSHVSARLGRRYHLTPR